MGGWACIVRFGWSMVQDTAGTHAAYMHEGDGGKWTAWLSVLGAQCNNALKMYAGGDAMASRREDGGCGGADSSNNREGVQEGDAVAAPHPAPGGSTRHCRVSRTLRILPDRAPPAICTGQSALQRAGDASAGCISCTQIDYDSRPCACEKIQSRAWAATFPCRIRPNKFPAPAGGWLRRQHSRGKDVFPASTVLPGELQGIRAVGPMGWSKLCALTVGSLAVGVFLPGNTCGSSAAAS